MTFESACRMGTLARPAEVGQESPTYKFKYRRLLVLWAYLLGIVKSLKSPHEPDATRPQSELRFTISRSGRYASGSIHPQPKRCRADIESNHQAVRGKASDLSNGDGSLALASQTLRFGFDFSRTDLAVLRSRSSLGDSPQVSRV